MITIGEFYVSDSFTLTYTAPTMEHNPGPFNTSKVYQANEPAIVSLGSGELGFVMYADNLQGVNLDVTMTFYDITTPGTAIPTGWILPFIAPFGGAPNGVLMNAVARGGQYANAGRYMKRPVRVGINAPNDPGHIYLVGPRFVVNSGISGTLAYQYFMQGTFETLEVPAGATTTFTLNGLTYTVTST